MKTKHFESELSSEALTELAALNVNIGANYRVADFDFGIDDSWLESFIEDYNICD